MQNVDVYEIDRYIKNAYSVKTLVNLSWNKDTASFQIKGHIPSSSMKRLDKMKVIGNVYEKWS